MVIQGSKRTKQKFLNLLCPRPKTTQHHFHCILFFKTEHSVSQDLSKGEISSTSWWEEQHVYTRIVGSHLCRCTITVLPLVDSSHLSNMLYTLLRRSEISSSYDLRFKVHYLIICVWMKLLGYSSSWFGYLLTKTTSYSPCSPVYLIYNFETGTVNHSRYCY